MHSLFSLSSLRVCVLQAYEDVLEAVWETALSTSQFVSQKRLNPDVSVFNVAPHWVARIFQGWSFGQDMIGVAEQDGDMWTTENMESISQLWTGRVNINGTGAVWVDVPEQGFC